MSHSTLSNRSTSAQDVGTDPLFFGVAHREFSFAADLAASENNHKCPIWFGQEDGSESGGGSLDRQWFRLNGWLWLNPPFKDIEPWARKCVLESAEGARIAMLVPVSTDSDWFRTYVWGRAEIRWLNARMIFDYVHKKGPHIGEQNTDPYPKPLMLCLYERGRFPRADPWDWRACLPKRQRRRVA